MARRKREEAEKAERRENGRIFGEAGKAEREARGQPERAGVARLARRREQDFGDRPARRGQAEQQRRVGHDEAVGQHEEIGASR